MMRASGPGRIGYFGKIDTRSDFIKCAQDIPLMQVLDDWLAQVMMQLPGEARWKLYYDALAPLHFAFVGLRRRHAVAGHIVASCDTSGRRFPFLMMRTLEVADPGAFIETCPLVLEPLWSGMQDMAGKVIGQADPAAGLAAIPETDITLDERHGAGLNTFLATGTIASLAALLGHADPRQVMLALGLLLQPVFGSAEPELEKSLVLPLPEQATAQSAVAAFWLSLIVPFLKRADLELALFMTRQDARPVLVVGFCGACADTLQAIIDPILGASEQISFADTAWVQDQIGLDVDVRTLASYLEQAQLPLKLARELFIQTFTGAPP
jgi:type VI secretion system protein ImpM